MALIKTQKAKSEYIQNEIKKKILIDLKEKLPEPSSFEFKNAKYEECNYFWDITDLSFSSNGQIEKLSFEVTENDEGHGIFTAMQFDYTNCGDKIALPTLKEILSGKYDRDCGIHDKGEDLIKQAPEVLDLTPYIEEYRQKMKIQEPKSSLNQHSKKINTLKHKKKIFKFGL